MLTSTLHQTQNNNNYCHKQVAKALKPSKLPSSPQAYTITTMSLFKSNKNKSASAASTPAQTPRTSMQGTRPSYTNTMTVEQAVEALEKSVQYNSSRGYRM
ncbi:hypothetical protein BGZ80_005973 [Entomortierella chlamydospora]|uniref:Uncharacterized protein n=1 Tax=Entomortierella chlamydospora TaxID=101097 RepID=A0A9P6MI68_9FUNG|nr:hypothetical protein BGZ80_005973 [Entomortierella chlamydospora]